MKRVTPKEGISFTRSLTFFSTGFQETPRVKTGPYLGLTICDFYDFWTTEDYFGPLQSGG
jgi:hypothetical protein